MERRITSHPERENKLKAVAGLLQGLSYREMQEFVRDLRSHMESGPSEQDLADAILDTADALLSGKAS